MDENSKNLFLAIALSISVLIFWQVFYAGPRLIEEQERAEAQKQAQSQQQIQPGKAPLPDTSGGTTGVKPSISTDGTRTGAPQLPTVSMDNKAGRDRVLRSNPRVNIETPSLMGSIALKGARIDDLVLKKFNETVEPDSEKVTFFSPSGSAKPFYAEHGWVKDSTLNAKLPDSNTVWQVDGNSTLTPGTPVTLVYDNNEGLIFRRTITVDSDYMFNIRQEVENKTGQAVTLFPYGLISRHSRPESSNFFILHEGLIGFLGEAGLQEIDYSDVIDDGAQKFKEKSGWLGITDKYWAAVLIPAQNQTYDANFSGVAQNEREFFQTDFLSSAVTIAPNQVSSISSNLFAGAKQVHLVDNYAENLKIENFDLLIDWGWFYFLTKPLFQALDYFFRLLGNFGLSILVVTILIKIALFWFANKSYVSMSKMKKLQPEMQKLRERYPDDKMKQQQALMELYKKEKVNPMSGCLPILIQIPVFFALYKVLFVTIEMRHAPFYGWIKDLSAADPTSLFNLFGLLPWTPPSFLQIGIWPLIMGITMWVQMKLNPQQPDPIQQKIFTWMPVVFTFILAPFPAGLVIYWAWNNTLSIIQQWIIMARQGVKVDLFGNMGLDKIKAMKVPKLPGSGKS